MVTAPRKGRVGVHMGPSGWTMDVYEGDRFQGSVWCPRKPTEADKRQAVWQQLGAGAVLVR